MAGAASMLVMSRKELTSEELDTVRISQRTTTVISANRVDRDERGSHRTRQRVGYVQDQEGCGPPGLCATGGGGLARVPNLRACEHLCHRSGAAGESGDLTSCGGTVQSAWQSTSSETHRGRKIGLPE